MLSKVTNSSINLGTGQIINYVKANPDIQIDRIQDNLTGWLLIKLKSGKIYMYNYFNNRVYLHNRIQIHFNNKICTKTIDSFDQNNINLSNQLRKYILKLILSIGYPIDTMLGIGGEYYIYWLFLEKISNLIGISNHESIIADANYNCPFSKNYLVDYNNLPSYPVIPIVDVILLNVFQINSNIIKYMSRIKFKKIIIISCNLSDSKLSLISKHFHIQNIKYFNNITNLIRIIEI